VNNGKENISNKTSRLASCKRQGSLSRQRPARRLSDQQGGKGQGQARQGNETAEKKKAEVKEKNQMGQDKDRQSESGSLRIWLK